MKFIYYYSGNQLVNLDIFADILADFSCKSARTSLSAVLDQ